MARPLSYFSRRKQRAVMLFLEITHVVIVIIVIIVINVSVVLNVSDVSNVIDAFNC